MECSVCYGDLSPKNSCNLSCSHSFCKSCIKTWFMKGTGSGCPMCRASIKFKGFDKLIDTWKAEKYNIQCNEVFSESFDDIITQHLKEEDMSYNLNLALMRLEVSYKIMKEADIKPEHIIFIIQADVYFVELDEKSLAIHYEPLTEKVSRYSKGVKKSIIL